MGLLAATVWATSAAFAQESSSEPGYYVDGTKTLEKVQLRPGHSEVTIYATSDAMCADQDGLAERVLAENAQAILDGKQPPSDNYGMLDSPKYFSVQPGETQEMVLYCYSAAQIEAYYRKVRELAKPKE